MVATLDSNILGKLLLIQSTLHVMPSEDKLIDFLKRGLSQIPGIKKVGACINGKTFFEDFSYSKDREEILKKECRNCISAWQESESISGIRCVWETQNGSITCLEIRTSNAIYGFILFSKSNDEAFSLYKPYLENTVNLLALLLENRHQHNKLVINQEELEQKVKERTYELVNEIHERKAIEKKLKVREKFLRTIYEASDNVSFITTDFGGKDAKILTFSPGAEKIFRYKENEVIGKKVEILHAPADISMFYEIQDIIRKGLKGYSGEAILKRKSGEKFPSILTIYPLMNENGDITGTLVVTLDISALKHAEEDLHITQFAVDRGSDAAFWVCPDGTFSYVNKAACERLGYSNSEFLGMCLSDVDPNFSAERWPQHWKEIKEKKTFMFETIHKAKDGSIFPVEVVVNYMEFRGKEYNCAFARDISKRKKVSEEKKAVEDRLRQAQKMEAIGTLAGGIAHDFNNILSVILGYADLAFEGAPVESTLRMNLDKILKAGFRAKDLVKQILTFSRQTGVNPVPLNPAKTLKEAIILLRSSIPTTIKIIDIIDPDSGIILADPTQIHQVLINLCTNAYHAMELTGGEIKIVLKSVYLSQEDVLPEQGVDAGEYICLTVQDTGPGILPTVQERIFDPYFTTKETGKGTGLGLSIVHGIVKDFNGFIRFNSERGKGTAFHVFFPSVKKKVLPEESITEPVQKGTESILFIDDDETVAEVGELILKEIGYTVTVKTNSIDALETFRNKPDLFDLVITDQIMPNMTGIELAKRMLQIEPGIPIILCTGYNNTISEIKANSLGIKGVALKPILKKDIAKLIRKVLNGD